MLSVLDRRRFIGRLAAGLAATAWLGRPKAARADTTGIGPFIGEIMLISCNFPPKGWAFCNGQLLPINQNQALFSLLGTNYGGDGRVTFALPDLRDRVPLHFGQGPGLTLRSVGERQGEAAHTLTLAEAPAHAHGVRASSALGTSVSPTGMVPAKNPAQYPQYAAGPDLVMSTSAIGGVGGSQAHPNVQPCLGLYYCIALVGVYPSQS
jgi:microcystin-dependent protein